MSREFYVPCTPYAYQIRSKYQSISERFKSLLRSINSRQHRVNNSDTRIRRRRRRIFREENSSRNIEKLDGTSSNCKTKEEVSNVATTSFEDNERRSETTIDLSTSSMLTANNSNDDDEEEEQQQQQQQQPQPDEEPSMFPTERIISLENAIVPNGRRNRNARRRQLTRMVSNSTNTVEITQEMNLESFFGSDAIVAENPIEYGAALHSIQFGMQRIAEPINIVPGLFITQEDQPYQSEISFDDYTNENSINESNMVNGSEVSSYTDSIEEVERRDQASGQDDELPILFYDPTTPMFLRKSLYQNDDPSIY